MYSLQAHTQSNKEHKVISIFNKWPSFINHICERESIHDLRHFVEQAINYAVRTLQYKSLPNIVLTALNDSPIDIQKTLLLHESISNARYVSINHLKFISGDCVLDDEGKRIDILYCQTNTIERFVSLVGEKGNLLELIFKNRLYLIYPPAASKGNTFLLNNEGG